MILKQFWQKGIEPSSFTAVFKRINSAALTDCVNVKEVLYTSGVLHRHDTIIRL